MDLAGPATGRGLDLGKKNEPPPPAAPPPPADDGLSPFQRFAPSADQLSGAAEARSGESMQVMAIVFGLVFMVGAAAVVTLVIAVLGFYTMGDMIEDGALAGLDPKQGEDGEHIKDTGVVPEVIVKRPSGGGGGSKPKADEPAPEPVPQAPTTGNGTILIEGDMMFHSIEVNCPASGIRTRAQFRSNKATAYGLPINEDCTVTFQGSQPAKASIRGNQTKSCTFNPTLCRLQ